MTVNSQLEIIVKEEKGGDIEIAMMTQAMMIVESAAEESII